MRRYIAYLKAVIRHKWYVAIEGWKLGVPLHRLIIHDFDKFYPSMLIAYAQNFYNPDGTSRRGKQTEAFKRTWNNHQKRNRHHWQYWLLTMDDGGTEPLMMDRKDILEMIADWRGAGRAYNPDWMPDETVKWYMKRWDRLILHPATRSLVEAILQVQPSDRQLARLLPDLVKRN